MFGVQLVTGAADLACACCISGVTRCHTCSKSGILLATSLELMRSKSILAANETRPIVVSRDESAAFDDRAF